MSFKPYKQILSAAELKSLHEEAVLNGKQEVGISRGKILYAWDEERSTIKAITRTEAAERLNLTPAEVDKIIETDGQVVFDEPKAEVAYAGFPEPAVHEELVEDDAPEEETVPVVEEPTPEVKEEPKSDDPDPVQTPYEEPKSETPAIASPEAPESVQAAPADQIKAVIDKIVDALQELKNLI